MPKNGTVESLIEGARLTFANANSLFYEAAALTKTKAYSRAIFLHQISIEECSKVEMLGAAVAELLIGEKVDLKALEKAFRSHEAKNRNNAYYLKSSKAEIAARKSGHVKAAIDAFRKIQDEFHERSNLAKNSSLYVDFSEGAFSAPVTRLKELVKIQRLNEKYLSVAHANINLMLRCEKEPDKMRITLERVAKRLRSLKDEFQDNPNTAAKTLFEEILAEAKQRRA